MKPRNLYRIFIGTLMILSSLIAMIQNGGDRIIGMMLLVAGLAFFVTGIFRHRRDGDGPESDERSRKIGACGLSYAWLTGLLFMFCLFWLDYAGIFRPETRVALALSIVILALSAFLFQAYFFRRGDVDGNCSMHRDR